MKVPLFKTYSDESDIEAVAAIIRRGSYWALGPEIEQFENELAKFLKVKHALLFNSGTSALHLLLKSYGVAGGEVIVPSFTFIATANAVVLAGATPVFAESEPETFGLDSADVEKRINGKTRAIVCLHYGGFPSRDSTQLRRIADEHGIVLIEDAAESLGSHIDGKMVGTFGHAAMFSFCQNKVISTGEGGLIVTDDQGIFERCKLLRSHGRVELAEDYFASINDNDYIEAGYNLRMPTMLAALGLSQFRKIEKVIQMRREKAHKLTASLSNVKEITVPKELPGHFQVYQMYTIQLPDKKTRDGLQNHLARRGVMSKIYFNPVHLKTLYTKSYGCRKGDLPSTEALSDRVLNIPLYPGLSDEELQCMIDEITAFFRGRK